MLVHNIENCFVIKNVSLKSYNSWHISDYSGNSEIFKTVITSIRNNNHDIYSKLRLLATLQHIHNVQYNVSCGKRGVSGQTIPVARQHDKMWQR